MAFSRGCANALYHCGVCDKHTSDHGGIRSCDLVEQQPRPLRPAMFYTNDAELIGNDLIESGIKLTFNDHRSPVTALFWDGRIHCQKHHCRKPWKFSLAVWTSAAAYILFVFSGYFPMTIFFGNIQTKLSCRPIEICDFVWRCTYDRGYMWNKKIFWNCFRHSCTLVEKKLFRSAWPCPPPTPVRNNFTCNYE